MHSGDPIQLKGHVNKRVKIRSKHHHFDKCVNQDSIIWQILVDTLLKTMLLNAYFNLVFFTILGFYQVETMLIARQIGNMKW